MVPRITSKGKSFKGAGAYFLHDLGKAQTAERVEFTHTVNMLTDDPEKALKVMAWTAAHAQELKEISGQKSTGRKAENPVYTYCLAWAPDQDPTREEMTALGVRSMETLGVAHHEAMFVAHNDTPHKHLHVILNRVDPETGLMAKMSHDRNLLSRLAQSYEEETGRVYCAQRVENNRRRDLGERNVKAEPTERLAETAEYQGRRAARVEAQRQAGALALERLQVERAKETQGRDLQAAFDQAAGVDDRQYRAKELDRPASDEAGQARAAWADEWGLQKAANRQAALDRREQVRRASLDERRAQAWDAYEAGRWQVLNDRHTTRREALHEQHAAAEAVFDRRLADKYAPNETALQRRREAAEATLQERGLRKALDHVTGKRAQAADVLDGLRRATEALQAQKDRERGDYVAKLATQREAQRLQQESERRREADKLQITKARQDAAFERMERARAERLKERQAAASTPDLKRDAQQLAERAYVRQVGEQRVHNVEISEFEGHANWRDLGWGAGYDR